MKPQTRQVLDHLQKYGQITHMRAEHDYGITRVASRVNELRLLGYDIQTEVVRGVNRFGNPTHYAIYRMVSIEA